MSGTSPVNRLLTLTLGAMLAACGAPSAVPPIPESVVNLSPSNWPAGEYERFLDAQDVDRIAAGHAEGNNGAVTVAYNGLAARAGLEALKQGGNAIDAAMTTALTQVALTAGAPISYFGILSLVYYDAGTGRVHTMNAEWNTVLGETDAKSIPGGMGMGSEAELRGLGPPSGRTAMVGGFMKGVEAAHRRFGKLPFDQLLVPAIHVAENGMPITAKMAGYLEFRGEDLKRLPETRDVFTKSDGTLYQKGELLRQPALAATLRAVAKQGADYMYKGPWAQRLVAAVQADGGKMTLEDLARYEVMWADPLIGRIGKYEVHTNPVPDLGGVALIEAQNMAAAARLTDDGHWIESGKALRKAVDIAQLVFLDYVPDEIKAQVFPGMDLSPQARVSREHAADLWARVASGVKPFQWKSPGPKHSDDVVAIDKDGNIAAITHSINTVLWGKTAIVVGGITIADAAAFQQAQIAKIKPGGRLPAPTETGILFKEGKPVLGFASMGSGLHQRTFQCLLNYTAFDMSVREAIDAADFFLPATDPKTFALTVNVPKGRFPRTVLDEMGYAYEEIDTSLARFAGEGIWVAISRDPATGQLQAASHNRNNSAAVAY